MADLTASLKQVRTPQNFQQAEETVIFKVDMIAEGATAASAHKLYTAPVGKAVVGGYVISDTAPDNTLTFSVGGDDVTGVVTAANFAAGDIVPFDFAVGGGTTSSAGYAKSAVVDIEVTPGGTLTSGVYWLVLKVIDVANLQIRY